MRCDHSGSSYLGHRVEGIVVVTGVRRMLSCAVLGLVFATLVAGDTSALASEVAGGRGSGGLRDGGLHVGGFYGGPDSRTYDSSGLRYGAGRSIRAPVVAVSASVSVAVYGAVRSGWTPVTDAVATR
jgi:hypothetical protein